MVIAFVSPDEVVLTSTQRNLEVMMIPVVQDVLVDIQWKELQLSILCQLNHPFQRHSGANHGLDGDVADLDDAHEDDVDYTANVPANTVESVWNQLVDNDQAWGGFVPELVEYLGNEWYLRRM